ncbi:limulus clotting factor C isoform X1 [Manduca sexta]|uniref:limulus clotting factor C isoform X1 n=1 Tax=Manduca sexta TaxID=7130 RepID=UPI0011831AF4|nr:limulus clotting factor C isoform X1 [Manduca sexta]
MIRTITALAILAITVPTHEQSTPVSPCPNVFEYEPPGTEAGRWYGVVHLSTDSTLHSLWLNIVLDGKADILGNWVGDVTTQDNIDFKIENTQMKISPGPAVAVRFFVQYNTLTKAPLLQAIRLNGREICNANAPQPAVERPVITQRPVRVDSTSSRPQTVKPQSTNSRKESIPELPLNTRPIQGRPSSEGPVYVKPANVPSPSSISDVSTQTYNANTRPTNTRLTPAPPTRTTTRRQEVLDFDDNASNAEEPEYFSGGQPTFIIPNKNDNSHSNSNKRQQQNHCGRVLLNNPIPLVVNGTPTLEGQWPWQIAVYQTQTVDNKYICGGTLISHKHIITAAHCVTRKGSRRVVNKNTLTVYLGKHNLRTSVDGVQIKFVEKIILHPMYNASTFTSDLAILELRESVTYSNWVQPACLWPDNAINLSNVIGKKGSVVGWGFDETGVATEELSLVEMPVVDTETCIRSYSEFFIRFTSEYTYCAGYRDGVYNTHTGARESTSVCNGDSGGGMVFKIGDYWYLRGLVSLSVARQNEFRCDPSHYVVFTDLAKFLPWIKQSIYDY